MAQLSVRRLRPVVDATREIPGPGIESGFVKMKSVAHKSNAVKVSKIIAC